MCDHRLWGAIDGLVCIRTTPHDPHAPGGHQYAASSASDLDDRHDDGGHG